MFAVAVAAAFNGPAAHQVHRAAKHFRQFLLHVRPVEQGRSGITSKRGQQINVAFIAKIIAQRRAEQFEPGNAVFPAESSK